MKETLPPLFEHNGLHTLASCTPKVYPFLVYSRMGDGTFMTKTFGFGLNHFLFLLLGGNTICIGIGYVRAVEEAKSQGFR